MIRGSGPVLNGVKEDQRRLGRACPERSEGIQQFRNRAYDPATGTWIQEAPMGVAGGVNLYRFNNGNPVSFGDPLGLMPCKNSKGEEVPCPDKDKVAQRMRENARAESQGQCAKFCRQGLEAGGMDSEGRPTSAGDYGPFLESRGADQVPLEGYSPQKGDVVVFEKTSAHPHGHVAIFDGQIWISDFRQKNMNPYRNQSSAGSVSIYRFPGN